MEGLLGSVGADLGILVMGTDTGAPIPLPDGGFLRDDNDQIVIPAVDRQEIQRIATTLGARRTDVSVDNSDIQSLLSGAQSSITSDDSLERKTDTWIESWLLARHRSSTTDAALVSARGTQRSTGYDADD